MEDTTSENKNPVDGASWLSIIFFWWMNDVLRLGSRRPLTESDLFPVLDDYKSEVLVETVENYWFDEIRKCKSNNSKPRLWKVLMRLISRKSALAMIVLKAISSITVALLPLCLWLLLKTLNDGPNLNKKRAFMYVALLGVTALLRAASIQHYDTVSELWGLKLKVASIGLVYKKVLSLNRYSLEATLSGNTINLVSNDAQKIEKSVNQLGYVLSAPLELVIALVIMIHLIGWKALVGAAFFLFLVTFQMVMGKKAAKLRGKAAAFTDQRLVVMNEIISGIRAVKMYAWEWNFKDLVCDLRRKEMSLIRLKGLILSMLVVLYFTTPPIAALISVSTLVLTVGYLTSFEVFTVLLGIMTLRMTFCYSLSIAVQMVADAKVAVDRMQIFLTKYPSQSEVPGKEIMQNQLSTEMLTLDKTANENKRKMTVHLKSFRKLDESANGFYNTLGFNSNSKPTPTIYPEILSKVPLNTWADQLTTGLIASQETSESSSEGPHLSISDVSCSWSQDQLTETLKDINLNVLKGEMLAVTGTVGSGKSSLLTTILGELPLTKGEISYRGKVAYVPQIPWVFSGTIRENILFGLPFNQEKFQRVVEVCGLTKDLADFSNGDLTEIGQRGVTLSGGQKARVGLARAVYSDADIYLLDDPLSAVDTKVGRRLFDSCIVGHLSGRIRLLVTHQLQYLKDVPRIIVMENGSISHQGGYAELSDHVVFCDNFELSQPCEARLTRKMSLYELNRNRSKSDPVPPSYKENGFELPQLLTSDVLLQPRVSFVAENMSSRRPRSVSVFELRERKNIKNQMQGPSIPFALPKTHVGGRDNIGFVGSLELPTLQDNELCATTREITRSPALSSVSDVPEADQPPALDLKEEEESKMAGTVTWRLYWDYFKEGLPVPFIILLGVLSIIAQVCLIAPNWWLSRMAQMSRDDQKAPVTQVTHACLVALSFLAMTASSYFLYCILLKSAENLHNRITIATIKAPVLFFDRNPAGRILNRFSKDVGCMDDVLPPVFLQTSIIGLFSICVLLVPVATNYWILLALFPMVSIFVYYGRYYLKSSRELKRIEAVTCSPVYSHITETANGLEIVHTSNMSRTFQERLHRYQNENTRAFFMLVSMNRWLGLRLDLFSGVFVVAVAVAAILVTEDPALAGLALTYALQALDLTQYTVRLASDVENVMTSVERVMMYTKIDPEPGYSNETHPPESWPSEGSIAIDKLSLVYFKGGPQILKDISFCVSSKAKVGVVGRTGAGKSSLVSALFRMPESSGKILIDGVDMATVNLQEARRSMAVITQDPVLFGGTLKRNLDPFSQHDDQHLWTALGEVQLKTLVADLPGQLEFRLRESGTNLSVGERQLLCLARALVQKSKIIIMDEATANVDFKTDRLIQEVIRDKFKGSTVLTIAHRLNTIMGYDKVLVLDGGRVVEFDKPDMLIKKGGLFAEMVKSQTQGAKH